MSNGDDILGDFAPWETHNRGHLRMRQFVTYENAPRDVKNRGQRSFERNNRSRAGDVFVNNWHTWLEEMESENP